jgi:hypothetical protein
MKRYLFVIATVLSTAAAVATVQAAGPKSEVSPGPAAYARLKTLVGEWEADTAMGKAHVSYELIAGARPWWKRKPGTRCRPCSPSTTWTATGCC